MKKITDLEVKGKRILLRLDLNLPFKDGKVSDHTRIIRSLDTINYLINNEAKIIIISHMGRPKGKFVRELSLAPIADEIQKFIGKNIGFISNIWSKNLIDKINQMQNSDILLIENLRFWKGEESNDQDFIDRICELGDYYVNDSFSCSHRDHASMSGIPKKLPSAAGFSLLNEIENITKILHMPKKPYTGLIGGAKISTKITLLENLVSKLDNLIISGLMANYFLKFQGYQIGDTIIDDKYLADVGRILEKAKKYNCNIILPSDFIVAKNDDYLKSSIVRISKNENFNGVIYDIGPLSLENILKIILNSATLVWNGSLGMFEELPFDISTRSMVRKIISLTKFDNLISIAGGGDTLAAIKLAGLSEELSYVSTGGGAFLEWLEYGKLPAIEALKKN